MKWRDFFFTYYNICKKIVQTIVSILFCYIFYWISYTFVYLIENINLTKVTTMTRNSLRINIYNYNQV